MIASGAERCDTRSNKAVPLPASAWRMPYGCAADARGAGGDGASTRTHSRSPSLSAVTGGMRRGGSKHGARLKGKGRSGASMPMRPDLSRRSDGVSATTTSADGGGGVYRGAGAGGRLDGAERPGAMGQGCMRPRQVCRGTSILALRARVPGARCQGQGARGRADESMGRARKCCRHLPSSSRSAWASGQSCRLVPLW